MTFGSHLYYVGSAGVARTAASEAALWANFFLLIGIVLFVERRQLASIGLRPLRWWTLPLGVLAGVTSGGVFRLAYVLMIKLGITPNEAAVKAITSLPFTMRILLVLTAAVVEETLFRSYPIERFTEMFGNKWVAGCITLIIFTVAHVPFWGAAQMIPTFAGSIFITLLYLWKRDLMLNIVAHLVVNGIGLILVPALLHRVS
jgi:membrane protease YdiL (CAAX protease family)